MTILTVTQIELDNFAIFSTAKCKETSEAGAESCNQSCMGLTIDSWTGHPQSKIPATPMREQADRVLASTQNFGLGLAESLPTLLLS